MLVMKKELTPEQAYVRAEAYCAPAERSERQVRQKLALWGLPEQHHQAVIDRLGQENYLNETRYCRSFVHDKWLYSRWGRVKIAHALAMQGVGNAPIREALLQIDDAEYAHTLRELLGAKARSTKAASPAELRAKLFRFAAGRGFESDVIQRQLPDDADEC